ncbi:MAG: TIM barrel protein [Victivallaceae bacterium]|nr:TIM barrel protein [Victivallaceae bacterium]
MVNPLSRFGLSSNWFPDGSSARDIMENLEALGINNLELSYRAGSGFIGEVSRLVATGKVKVIGVHDVCPRPPGYCNESLAAVNETERRAAVNLVKRNSVVTAGKFGAQYIVLHLGKVEMNLNTPELAESLTDLEKYRSEFMTERRRFAAPHLEAVKRSLTELLDFAGAANLKFTVENRFWFEEIPDFAEIGMLLNSMNSPRLSYWHDTSHAQAMENLGFCAQRAYLEAYGDRLAGFHISDMSFGKVLTSGWLREYVKFQTEHKAPGQGNINFDFLREYAGRNDVCFILEPYGNVPLNQLAESVKYLLQIFKTGKRENVNRS